MRFTLLADELFSDTFPNFAVEIFDEELIAVEIVAVEIVAVRVLDNRLIFSEVVDTFVGLVVDDNDCVDLAGIIGLG